MSTVLVRFRILLRRIFDEDLKIIVAFMFVLISIWAIFPLTMGWFSDAGSGFNTPSVGQDKRTQYLDTDHDLLPDIIEEAPRGSTVRDPASGKYIGKGTDTNPNRRDSDGDLFTDAAEDNLGTDPTSFLNPGWIWFFWLGGAGYAIYYKTIRNEDRLRKYKEFDELQSSGGVAGGGSKFAYGGSIFSKRPSELSADERKELIQKDQRYHQMMSGEQKVEGISKTPRRIKKLIFQLIIAIIITLIIRFYVTN